VALLVADRGERRVRHELTGRARGERRATIGDPCAADDVKRVDGAAVERERASGMLGVLGDRCERDERCLPRRATGRG